MVTELNDIRSMQDKQPQQPQQQDEQQNNGEVDLYLFGGFIDDKHYSENLFSEIMAYCSCSPYTISFRVAYCYSLNDVVKDSKHSCEIYGVAVDITSKTFYVATCKNHGPDGVLRDVRMSSVESFSPIYDYRKQLVYVEPFTFRKQKWTQELLSLDDVTYLRYCSTSPHCEPAPFCLLTCITIIRKIC